MPSRGSGPLASGGKVRENVPSHRFPGTQSLALAKGLRLEAALDYAAGRLTVEVGHAAGHLLPSGYVDRRLIVRATFTDREGAPVATLERSHGIFLVDAEGRPAPFFRATRVLRDDRIAPGRSHGDVFELPAPLRARAALPARVKVEILSSPTAPELADTYGPPEQQVLRAALFQLSPSGPDVALRRLRAQGG